MTEEWSHADDARADRTLGLVASYVGAERDVFVVDEPASRCAERLRPASRSVTVSRLADEGAGEARAHEANGASRSLGRGRRFDAAVVAEGAVARCLLDGARSERLAGLLSDEGFVVVVASNLESFTVKLPLLAGKPTPGDHHHPIPRMTLDALRTVLDRAGYDVGHVESIEHTAQEALALADSLGLDRSLVEPLLDGRMSLTSGFVAVAFPRKAVAMGPLRFRAHALQATAERLQLEVAEARRAAAASEQQVQVLEQRVDALAARLDEAPREPVRDGAGAVLSDPEALARVREAARALAGATRTRAPSADDPSWLAYQHMVHRVRGAVDACTPARAKVLVVSKGDDMLASFPQRSGVHFPSDARGVYAGYHPADSAEAIAHLERCVEEEGAQYLVLPSSSFWWLDHYGEFADHLNTRYRKVVDQPGTCALYELQRKAAADE